MTSTARGLGRLHAPDPNDHRYGLSMVLRQLQRELAPKPRNSPYHLGPVLDQGSTNMCVGYSCRARLAAAPIMVRSGIDPQNIYHEAQKVDEWPGEDYEGTSVRAGFKVLQAKGYFKSYVWCNSMAQVEQFILGGFGTVVFGTNWYTGMFEPDSTGLIKVTGQIEGGHAYHIVWCDKVNRIAWGQQSWGDEWGAHFKGVKGKGFFQLSYDDGDRLIAEDGEVGAPVEIKLKVPVIS